MLCAVVGGILEYIAPDKSKKMIRIIVVAVILAVTLSPLLKIDIDFNIDDEEYTEDNSYENLLHMRNLVEKKVRSDMREVIINAGVNEYEIYVTTDGDEESQTVYLQSVEILVGKDFAHLTQQIKDSAPEQYRSIVEVGVKDG
jgi:hypothetical protein